MQVFIQIAAFSLQTDGSGRPVLTKGKRPKSFQIPGLASQFCQMGSVLKKLNTKLYIIFLKISGRLTNNCTDAKQTK